MVYTRTKAAYIPSESRLDGCDILFKFLGADGKEVPFRCDAKRFLIDAWQSAADELWHSPLRASETTFTLGVVSLWHYCSDFGHITDHRPTRTFIGPLLCAMMLSLLAQMAVATLTSTSLMPTFDWHLSESSPRMAVSSRRNISRSLKTDQGGYTISSETCRN